MSLEHLRTGLGLNVEFELPLWKLQGPLLGCKLIDLLLFHIT